MVTVPSSALVQQPLSVKACLYHLWGWLSVTYGSPHLWITHSRIVSPTYGGTIHMVLEPMTVMCCYVVRVNDYNTKPAPVHTISRAWIFMKLLFLELKRIDSHLLWLSGLLFYSNDFRFRRKHSSPAGEKLVSFSPFESMKVSSTFLF